MRSGSGIEPTLNYPGDLVIDPFCGSGGWECICAATSRWGISCDLVADGSISTTTTAVA
jgi:hypothetical protein